MRTRPISVPVLATLLVAASTACTTESNYLRPEGPRFAADYAARNGWTDVAPASDDGIVPLTSSAPPSASSGGRGAIRVVSYNVRYGEHLDEAIAELTEAPELRDADVYLLQEMNADAVDRVARALGCSYVYYPASQRTWGLDFGNAVLTRGEVRDDRKVLLPHVHPINRQARIAVGADVAVDGGELSAFSVHTEMPLLSLGDRVEQIETLVSAASRSTAPCLVAGDFNTLTGTSLQRFETVFADHGFKRATDGLGGTWSYGPLVYGLDHVFVRGFDVVAMGKLERASASDHLPIWVELVPRATEDRL